jgi:hypothetical protein
MLTLNPRVSSPAFPSIFPSPPIRTLDIRYLCLFVVLQSEGFGGMGAAWRPAPSANAPVVGSSDLGRHPFAMGNPMDQKVRPESP